VLSEWKVHCAHVSVGRTFALGFNVLYSSDKREFQLIPQMFTVQP